MVSLYLVRILPSLCSPLPTRSSSSRSRAAVMDASNTGGLISPERRLPVLLFDVMDTIVKDPFYHHIPAFFQMSMKELLEAKHPTAWVEFEEGQIDEIELAKKFFKDGRSFDLEGLKECMVQAYSYVDGKRKPSRDSYIDVLNHLAIEPSNCVFIDDRVGNIEAAKNAGMIGLHFKNSELLKNDLFSLGIEVTPLDIS